MQNRNFEKITEILKHRDSLLEISGLGGSAKGYFLSLCFNQNPHAMLVATITEEAALTLAKDLAFYLGESLTYQGGALISNRVFTIPSWDADPFSPIQPHPDCIAARLGALHRLQCSSSAFIAVASLPSLLQKAPPPSFLEESSFEIKQGKHTRESLIEKLLKLGYVQAKLVEVLGSFAPRGNIVDIFSPYEALPIRIEFFGDEIETLRFFAPETQRSLQSIEKTLITPIKEFLSPLTPRDRSRLKERADSIGFPKPKRDALTEALSRGEQPPFSEYLTPLFYDSLSPLFHYLPDQATVFLDEPISFKQELARFKERRTLLFDRALSKGELLPEQENLYLSEEGFSQALKKFLTHTLTQFRGIPLKEMGEPILRESPQEGRRSLQLTYDCEDHAKLHDLLQLQRKLHRDEPLEPLLGAMKQWEEEGVTPVFVTADLSRASHLQKLLSFHRIQTIVSSTAGLPKIIRPKAQAFWITQGYIGQGFKSRYFGFAPVSEWDLFQRKSVPFRTQKEKSPTMLLSTLQSGGFVVHVNYGIARFEGLQTLIVKGITGEYVLLTFRGGDKLYVPVYQLNLLQKYVGGGDTSPILSQLGGKQWEKIRGRVQRAIREVASELLSLYAIRQSHKGFSYSLPDHHFMEFESSFPFEETPHQLKAIEETLADMQKDRPMDRLICGDVGFGKTEVAMRACFKAILDHKQAAILVPTTLLAHQHYRTFCERMKETGARIEVLSRLIPRRAQSQTLGHLKAGAVDIVIGTHRLLSRDVHFKDLGLIIVDEEQRFGVKQKEKLKHLKRTVDVLTLSATPIPRTLHMGISGLRDISVITTPPRDRMGVLTFVCPFDEEIIREAILREKSRGGQVFFINNRIETLPDTVQHLKGLLPGVTFRFAHGQLDQDVLEDTMIDFYDGKFDVLVTTTIIEAGLDCPNVNTIVINRADTFGLAELYQLRGRVGRSFRQAYAYLLVSDLEKLSPEARERLETIERYSDLGSGFAIAYRDLEIRGGGTLLGGEQSGHVGAVGFELYTDLLKRAVAELQGKSEEDQIDPEINIPIEAAIPKNYIPDPILRLDLYQRIAFCKTEDERRELQEELTDRFGPLPEPLHELFEMSRVKEILSPLHVLSLEGRGGALYYHFDPSTPIEPNKLIALAKSHPKKFRLRPDGVLRVHCDSPLSMELVQAESRFLLQNLLAPS